MIEHLLLDRALKAAIVVVAVTALALGLVIVWRRTK